MIISCYALNIFLNFHDDDTYHTKEMLYSNAINIKIGYQI